MARKKTDKGDKPATPVSESNYDDEYDDNDVDDVSLLLYASRKRMEKARHDE